MPNILDRFTLSRKTIPYNIFVYGNYLTCFIEIIGLTKHLELGMGLQK